MVERNVSWEYLVLAAVISLVIMAGIFAAGYSLSNYKVGSLRNDIRTLEVNQQSQLLTFELSENIQGKECGAMKEWVEKTVEESRELRRKVAAYEDSRKIGNPQYKTLKKRYMNLLVQNMLEVREVERNCARDLTEIIYFYSNDNCDSCEDQGTILTYYRRKYGDNLVVYPLDTDLELDSVNFLETHYNVTDYPTLVVEEEVYHGFQGKQKLGRTLERVNVTDEN